MYLIMNFLKYQLINTNIKLKKTIFLKFLKQLFLLKTAIPNSIKLKYVLEELNA